MRVLGVDESRIIIVKPRSGENLFRNSDIIQVFLSIHQGRLAPTQFCPLPAFYRTT